jgi:hypothetical protein
MLSHAPKPVTRVSIVWFTAMQNPVQITAVSIFDPLHNLVCLIMVIVPQQHRGFDKFTPSLVQHLSLERGPDLLA